VRLNRSHRRRLEIAAGVFLAVVVLVVGGTKLYFVSSFTPLHTDPAAVPSTTANADSGPHAGAIEEARRLARALLVAENLPSLSVAVARDGNIVWAEAFGFANVEPRVQATPLTRFRTGSVSKTLTAAAVALLYERGRIDLDAPVQTYVPKYPRKQWTVTTRQLLGDVAGVHRIRGDNNDNLPRDHCTSLDQALETFAGEPLLFAPGTKYRFSTYGWILLSAVVEGASGKPFATFMRREVFEPLGMDRTVLEGTDRDSDTTSFYSPRTAMGTKLGVQGAPAVDYSCLAGAGAFLSTPSDLVRLGSAMLKPGLLKPETIALFQTPLRLESGASAGFALGWKVDSVTLAGAPARLLRHRASLIGGANSLSMFPDLGLVIAVTSNGTGTERVDPFALQVAAAFVR
jgi:CubicO group peptidase (beta-lactamase class C family)